MTFMIIYVGMCLGSFCQVVAYRYPKGESFILGRSYCEKCYHKLSFMDTLPFFSFIFLKGKCRYCGYPISKRNLVIELFFGIGFYFLFLSTNRLVDLLFSILIYMLLLIIALIDLDTMYVYDQMMIILGVFCFLYSLILKNNFLFMIKGAFSISLVMLVVSELFKDSFGFGDIELLFVMGVLLGSKLILFSFYIAVFTASSFSVFLILSRNKTIKDRIAFCPFLCLGFFFSLLLVG